MTELKKLSIDVVSDVVCPWCLIGTRRLDQALASMPDLDADVTFHPFLLDPSIPPEGVDLREHLARKYNADPDTMFGRVEAAARESGIPLDFSRVRRFAPTAPAHTLIRHAKAHGTQHGIARAMFDTYFLEGRNLGDPEVLVDVATKHGFEADAARALLRDEQELAATRAAARGMSAQGISGVPFFIFGGKLALSGAQPVATMKAAIEKALAG